MQSTKVHSLCVDTIREMVFLLCHYLNQITVCSLKQANVNKIFFFKYMHIYILYKSLLNADACTFKCKINFDRASKSDMFG